MLTDQLRAAELRRVETRSCHAQHLNLAVTNYRTLHPPQEARRSRARVAAAHVLTDQLRAAELRARLAEEAAAEAEASKAEAERLKAELRQWQRLADSVAAGAGGAEGAGGSPAGSSKVQVIIAMQVRRRPISSFSASEFNCLPHEL